MFGTCSARNEIGCLPRGYTSRERSRQAAEAPPPGFHEAGRHSPRPRGPSVSRRFATAPETASAECRPRCTHLGSHARKGDHAHAKHDQKGLPPHAVHGRLRRRRDAATQPHQRRRAGPARTGLTARRAPRPQAPEKVATVTTVELSVATRLPCASRISAAARPQEVESGRATLTPSVAQRGPGQRADDPVDRKP